MILRRTLAVILSILPVVLVAAPTSSQLVGSWSFLNDAGTFYILTFKEDGKFNGYAERGAKRLVDFEGKWELKGSEVHYIYEKSEPLKLFSETGGKDKDEIIELKPSYLVFKGINGKVVRYNKVEPKK